MTTTTQYPYQVMPDLTDEEYQALKADIAIHGILIPVEHDEHKNTLDGHHRERAWRELQEEGIIAKDSEYPIIERVGWTEDQKLNHARAVNLIRRHLTPQQRKPIWIEMRRTGMSYRQIGEASGVSYETVRQGVNDPTVNNLTVGNDLPTTVIGKDGKERAATKPKKDKPQTQPEAPKTIVTTSGKKEEKLNAAIEKKGIKNIPQGVSTDAQVTKFVHVSQNSGENEWYTPECYANAAQIAMGSINTDPASSEIANATIKAEQYFTIETDGRQQKWKGNVWMNPPYSQPLVTEFCNLLVDKFNNKEINQACVLVNNATETNFYQNMLGSASAVCFIKSRVKFLDAEGKSTGAPLQGQTVLYFGNNTKSFAAAFSQFGVILYA
jgi:ParB family chromosome partitioning protein